MPRLRKSTALLVSTLAAGTLLYFGWMQLTRTRGSQQVAFTPASANCSTSGAWRYCVYRAPAGSNGDIVYHLPGRNLDEHAWNDGTYFTAMVQSEWRRTGVPPPTVVTVSHGPTWLLTPKGSKPASGLLEDFMVRLPQIEAKVGRPRRRILLGESMGGLNVLVAGLSHPTAFAKVAALCPGVYAVSPFGPLAATRKAMVRTGASPKMILGVWLMARTYLAGEDEWRRISPLQLIKRVGPDAPSLYLSCGLYDAYGNYEGTQQLAMIAPQRGVKTEWRPVYGGHCTVDIPSLASFLVT